MKIKQTAGRIKSINRLLILLFLCSILFFIIVFSGIYITRTCIKMNTLKRNSRDVSFHTFVFLLKDLIKSDWIIMISPQVKKESPLDTFYITAGKSDIRKLNANLPGNGKDQSITAYLKINDSDQTRKMELKYRGGSPWHWLYPQKSLKINLDKDELYKMEKKFTLINSPGPLPGIVDFIMNDLKRALGLITPDYYPVRIFMNNEYMGVYMYISQADEYIIRKFKRMPGSIYSGDSDCSVQNGVPALWTNSECWEKDSARNSEQESFRGDIEFFIKSINLSNETGFYDFVNTYINKESYYVFLAIETIFGAEHHEFMRNFTIYFDPYTGKYEPIQWDVPSMSFSGKGTVSYPLLKRMKLYPDFESEMDATAYRLLKENSQEEIIRRIDYYRETVWKDLKADKYRHTIEYIPGAGTGTRSISLGEIDAGIKAKKELLLKRRNDLEEHYESSYVRFKVIETNDLNTIIFKADGNSGIELSLDDFIDRSMTDHSGIKVFEDRNQNGKMDDTDRQIPEGSTIRLYPGRKTRQENTDVSDNPPWEINDLEEAPLYYSYIVTPLVKINRNTHYGVNLVTGSKVPVEYDTFDIEKETGSIHPWELPYKTRQSRVLSGRINVDETIIFDKYTEVKILPGTTIVLSPGKSIYFYGKVTAEGTMNQPIRFQARDESRPWGAIVVHGPDASGSSFSYCEVSNGSIDEMNLVNYTGQFSIHDLDDFRISHCKVGKNSIGDDCMHVACANGIIENCIFYAAPGDGLDVDIGEVSINNCLFITTGNDGVDLMTAKADITNTLFINCGDKGISIGEWSEALVRNTFYYYCLKGVEIKDKSVVDLSHSFILNSREKAINLYNKNLHYDQGGIANIDTVHIYKGKIDISVDEKSSVQTNNVIYDYAAFEEYLFIRSFLTGLSDWSSLEGQIESLINRYKMDE